MFPGETMKSGDLHSIENPFREIEKIVKNRPLKAGTLQNSNCNLNDSRVAKMENGMETPAHRHPLNFGQ